MHPITEVFANKSLLCALSAWFISQLLKGCFYGLRYHTWKLENFLTSGGMPSSHTASTVALALMIGFSEGFDSSFFAISAILAAVVMYDAAGVRRETGKQGKVINELLSFTMRDGNPLFSNALKEKIGHTPLEVIMGAVLGIVCSLVFTIL